MVKEDIERRLATIDKLLDAAEERLNVQDFTEYVTQKIVFRNENCHISCIHGKKSGLKFPAHVHPENTELLVVSLGRVMVTFEGHQVILDEGKSIPIPPNTPHGGMTLTDEAEIICVSIPSDLKTDKLFDMLGDLKRDRH